MKKNRTTKSTLYGNSAKFFLLNGKLCVFLQRSNLTSGTMPLTKEVSVFCTHILLTMQANRLVVGGSDTGGGGDGRVVAVGGAVLQYHDWQTAVTINDNDNDNEKS